MCVAVSNSFMLQCEDMKAPEQRLKQFNVEYKTRTMDDDRNGTRIDQLFFRDSDGYLKALEQRLKQFNVEYTTRTMDGDRNGTRIDQLFSRDSDGYCYNFNLKFIFNN